MNDFELKTQQFCEHQQFIKGYQPTTIKLYWLVLRMYREYARITRVEQTTTESVRGFFLDGRANRGWTASTYIRYYSNLLVFFRWCRQRGYLDFDPMEEIDLPKVPKSLPKKLSKQEAEHLLEVIQNYPYRYSYLRHRNYAMFQMFILTGLRKKELLDLRMVDVDLDNLTLFIRRGKGDKDRIVPMTMTLSKSLHRYLEERKRLKKTCPEFFTSLNKNAGLSCEGMKLIVEQLKSASGIDFHLHKLRHTFATLMLEGGCDIYSLAKMMGHSNIKTTTIYLSATAEHLRSQVGKHPLGG